MKKSGGIPGSWWNMLNPYERKRRAEELNNETLMLQAQRHMHCRTLADMSEPEIRELEEEYGCPVIRPRKNYAG